MIAAITAWGLAIFLVAFALILMGGACLPPTTKGWQAFAFFSCLAMCVAALTLVAQA